MEQNNAIKARGHVIGLAFVKFKAERLSFGMRNRTNNSSNIPFNLFHRGLEGRHTFNMQHSDSIPADLSNFDVADLIKTPHNTRLYNEVQNLKSLINELVDYQLAHPKKNNLVIREEMDDQKKVNIEIEKKEKYIRAQLSIIKSLYRQSVLKVREEKAKTSDDRAINDALILGLHNLKYEEQSLRSEISAAENYEYACFLRIKALR